MCKAELRNSTTCNLNRPEHQYHCQPVTVSLSRWQISERALLQHLKVGGADADPPPPVLTFLQQIQETAW